MRLIVSDSSCLIDLRKASLLEAFLGLPYEILIPNTLFEEELVRFTQEQKDLLIQGGLQVMDLPGESVLRAGSGPGPDSAELAWPWPPPGFSDGRPWRGRAPGPGTPEPSRPRGADRWWQPSVFLVGLGGPQGDPQDPSNFFLDLDDRLRLLELALQPGELTLEPLDPSVHRLRLRPSLFRPKPR